jgi:hypothetical protein
MARKPYVPVALRPPRLEKRLTGSGDYNLNDGSRSIGRVFKTTEGGRTWTLWLRGSNTFKKGFKTRQAALNYYKGRK